MGREHTSPPPSSALLPAGKGARGEGGVRDGAVGELKREGASKGAGLDGVAVAGELDDARRHVAHEVSVIIVTDAS